MPSHPTFDYYAELQVEREASQLEITASYRRLARIHHPDKNPDNQQAATAAFQRLQIAYETLSNPAQRVKYDDLRNPRHGAFFESDDEMWFDDEEEDEYEDNDDFFGDAFNYGSSFPHGSSFRYGHGGATYTTFEKMDAMFREAERMEDERREVMFQQLRQNQAADAARQKAREEAKKATAAIMQEKIDRRRDEEAGKQSVRWETLGAVTKDERKEACLHSEFCTKVQQKKKFKCAACGVKRGMTAFECPYCAVFLCQLCVSTFGERRAKASEKCSAKCNPTFEEPESEVKGAATVPEDFESAGLASTEPHGATPSNVSPKSGSLNDQPSETSTSRTDITTDDPIVGETFAPASAAQAEKPSSKTPPGGDAPTVSKEAAEHPPARKEAGDASRVQGNKGKTKTAANKKKFSTAGPDPGYKHGRHVRCHQFHKGGDGKCFIMHPELRTARKQESKPSPCGIVGEP